MLDNDAIFKEKNLLVRLAERLEKIKNHIQVACMPYVLSAKNKMNNAVRMVKKASKKVKGVVAGVGAATIITSTLLGISAYNNQVAFYSNDFWENESSAYTDVVPDYLKADLGIMHDSSDFGINKQNELIRLLPNDEGKIYVCIAENIDEIGKTTIGKSLEYFNGLFKAINPLYNFVVVEDIDQFHELEKQQKTIIRYDEFEEEAVDDVATLGQEKSSFSLKEKLIDKYMYAHDVTIRMNKNYFNNFSETRRLGIINHEFMHALGFRDVYDLNQYNYSDSIMNAVMSNWTSKITPSDLRVLFTAYSADFMNDNKIDYDKMDEAKKFIEEYSVEFYKDLANGFITYASKRSSVVFEEIDPSFLAGSTILLGGKVKITFKDDGTFEYTLAEENFEISHVDKIGYGTDKSIILPIKGKNESYYLLATRNGADLVIHDLLWTDYGYQFNQFTESEFFLGKLDNPDNTID